MPALAARRQSSYVKCLKRLAQHLYSLIDLLALEDELRRDNCAISGRLQVNSRVEELVLKHVPTTARFAIRLQIDARNHAVATDIGNARQLAQG